MPEEKEYRVELSAMATVRGSLYVKAASAEEAEQKALSLSGDTSWSYQGTQDDTIEAQAYEHN